MLISLTLKKPGIKSILRSLPDFQQGRGLGRFRDRQRIALRQNFACDRAEAMLQRLSFHWSDDAQPDRGGDEAAQMKEKKQARRAGAFQTEGARCRSENGREMSARRTGRYAAQGKFSPLRKETPGLGAGWRDWPRDW